MGGGWWTNFRFLVWQKSYQSAILGPIRWPICSMTNFVPLFTNWDTQLASSQPLTSYLAYWKLTLYSIKLKAYENIGMTKAKALWFMNGPLVSVDWLAWREFNQAGRDTVLQNGQFAACLFHAFWWIKWFSSTKIAHYSADKLPLLQYNEMCKKSWKNMQKTLKKIIKNWEKIL